MAKEKKESQVQKEICDYLRSKNYLYWRFSPETYNANLGIHIKHEHIPNGLADIMLVHPGDTKEHPSARYKWPTFIGLEVKKPKGGRPSAAQLLMQRRFNLNNAVYEFVKSVDDVKALGL